MVVQASARPNPDFDDYRSTSLRVFGWGQTIGVSGTFLFLAVLYFTSFERTLLLDLLAINVITALGAVGTLLLLRRNQTKLANYVFILATVVSISLALPIAGSGSGIAAVFVWPIACAALLLGGRGGVSIALLCGASILGEYALEQEGIIVPQLQGQLAQYIAVFADLLALVLTTIVTTVAGGSIRRSLNDARQDLAERRRAEDALRASEMQFRAVFENTLTAMFILNDAGQVLEANSEAARFLGTAAEQLRGQPFARLLVSSGNEPDEAVLPILAAATEFRRELSVRLANGQQAEVEVSAQAGFLPGYNLAVIRDISAQKQAERERLARQAAEQANQAKSAFLSRVSHELRTPLNAILGFAQLMEMSENSADDRESIDHILLAGRHLLDLINEVLEISRIEQGHITLNIEPVPLSSLLSEAVDIIRPLAANSGVVLQPPPTAVSDWIVLADRQRLWQVVLNLLANGAKYNRPGGCLKLSCTVVDEHHVRVMVSDTGLGIKPEYMIRLFTPFDRLGAEHLDIEGTGLGLALSQGLLQAMGSKIEVSSTPDVGSDFWFDLQLVEPGAEA